VKEKRYKVKCPACGKEIILRYSGDLESLRITDIFCGFGYGKCWKKYWRGKK
jgi:predicted RNA-binding Zn-ribbon protein involved in translation (DUF1610 family)